MLSETRCDECGNQSQCEVPFCGRKF